MPQVETDVFERLVRPYGTLDRATRWIAFVGLVGLVIVSMVIVLDIVMRGVFSHPLEGLEEITKFVFAIVIASCFPAGLVQGQNVAIRFLGSGLGPKAANWLEVLASACTLLFFVFLSWRLVIFTAAEAADDHYTQTLQLPTAPFWIIITAILCTSLPVQAAVLAVHLKRAVKGETRVPDEPDPGHPTTL